MTITIGCLVYENAQPMDIIGPWEVLSIWQSALKAPIQLYLISENGGLVNCDSHITLNTHLDFAHTGTLDYLIVPGGKGRRKEVHNERLITFIRDQAQKAGILSVCTGMFLIEKAGLLKGKPATTYWRALPEAAHLSSINLVLKRVVKAGNVWTAGGVSSGIDLAFALIAEVVSPEEAGKVQWLFEYFPDHTYYANTEMAKTLPPYDEADEPIIIPDYIKKLL